MSIRASDAPNLDRGIAQAGRGIADIVFLPVHLGNLLFQDVANRDPLERKDRSLEIPTLATTVRDIKEWVTSYHLSVFTLGNQKGEAVEQATKNLLERCFSWLDFSETGTALKDIIASKFGAVARFLTSWATQILHAAPYLAASALVVGSVLLYQASPIALLCCLAGAVFSVQLLQSFFIAKGVARAGNILQRELDGDVVAAKANIALEMGVAKVNHWLETTRPFSWVASGHPVARMIRGAIAFGALYTLDQYTSPLIATAALGTAICLLYKPNEERQESAEAAS